MLKAHKNFELGRNITNFVKVNHTGWFMHGADPDNASGYDLRRGHSNGIAIGTGMGQSEFVYHQHKSCANLELDVK